jgi:hypothetical protein
MSDSVAQAISGFTEIFSILSSSAILAKAFSKKDVLLLKYHEVLLYDNLFD